MDKQLISIVCLYLVIGRCWGDGPCYNLDGSCWGPVRYCTPRQWEGWGSCSHTCGGGVRRRTRTLDCVGYSDCLSGCGLGPNGRTDSGRCGEVCLHGWGFHSVRCNCPGQYYGRCCGIECPAIEHCVHRHCTDASNVVCRTCEDHKIFYKPTHGDKQCERKCAWNNHYCWPGTCGDDLKRNCKCAPGFRLESHGDTETSCQLEPSTNLSIETCETTIRSASGKQRSAVRTSSSSACEFLTDVYGNFQPDKLMFKMFAEFTVDVTAVTKPAFIKESNFGVTDTTVYLTRRPVTGGDALLSTNTQLVDSSNSINVKRTSSTTKNITLPSTRYKLTDGQRYPTPMPLFLHRNMGSPSNPLRMGSPSNLHLVLLSVDVIIERIELETEIKGHVFICTDTTIFRLCVKYEALGGGYLKSIDLRSSSHTESGPVPYKKIKTAKEICYRYDSTSPKHCQETGTCTTEPLHVQDRITRSGIIPLEFKGWEDPIPTGGNPSHASGIELYTITVNEVIPSTDPLKVDITPVMSINLNKTDTSVTLNLTSDKPKLYSITIEAKDVADNVKQGRRFVLYDNTSAIEARPDKPFTVTSASKQTNFTWQTHHNDICLRWKDRFHNNFYIHNALFNRIEPDPHGLIKGVYEQSSGPLPVSGTPNVFGIVKYIFSSTVNNGTLSREIHVPHFRNQSYCHHFDAKDGQTYTMNIRSVDIVNNTYTESRTVHIDRSVPHINNLWLIKDGYKRLFVHDRKDLSTMRLYFETLDPHSGIKNIEWSFGTTDAGNQLSTGMLPSGKINDPKCSNRTSTCYCPDVGACEISNYSIPLNKLVHANKHQGNHNRNYFFTVKVTNHAMLTNIEHLDVLVDDSPPEKGVVMEGPIDGLDIDYTSDSSFLVHWHGFIDHESGIKLYRVGLADRCLGKLELQAPQNVTDLIEYQEVPFTDTSMKLPANFTGKRYVTVVALNNAMDVSDAVCSDGITRDDSPPVIKNVTLEHARWSETFICHNGSPWLLHASISKVKLHPTDTCLHRCSNISGIHPLAQALPTNEVERKDEEVSNFMCDRLPTYTPDTIIYIPNDHINIKWEIDETGSQIQDFYVGFGLDPSNMSIPSLVDYQSTSKKTFFKRNHEGLGSDSLFYVFIKAVNKAGLERVTTIGPVLIDETPPRYKAVPLVDVQGEKILVGWENDTFYDEEQTSQIGQIFFQFAHDRIPVTPLLEWNLDESKPCPGFSGGCVAYPVRRLQRQDTDLGLEFYITLYVHNNAGHFIKLDTSTFRLPSRYPPGHAVVDDLDPEDTQDLPHQTDTNVHFKEHTLCARWSGFKHHENVSFEFGVGSSNASDDVISFYRINGTRSECLTSPSLQSGIQYFVLIRSTCSGGQTISTSNGITIMDQSSLKHLTVKVGENCLLAEPVYIHSLKLGGAHASIKVVSSLQIGTRYIADIESISVNDLTMSSSEAIVELLRVDSQSRFSIVSYVENPTLNFSSTSHSPSSNGTIKLFRCPPSGYQLSQNSVSAYWYYNNNTVPVMTYESALVLITCNDVSNSSCLDFITDFELSQTNNTSVFADLHLKVNKDYRVAVRPCTNNRCADFIMSDSFRIELTHIAGVVEKATLNVARDKHCYDVEMTWSQFDTDSGVRFYQWTISGDDQANRIMLEWQTVLSSNLTKYEITRCVELPVHAYSTLFGCVRAYTGAGLAVVVCEDMEVQTIGGYRSDAVYDIDMANSKWKDILQILHSSNAGDKYGLLHSFELDFGTSSSFVAGAIMYGTERNVTWSLMTSQHNPAICSNDKDCVQSRVTDTGYTAFDADDIKLDTLYYICAYSNTTYINRELFVETLDELESCSNGFILDDTPPTRGSVEVTTSRGYLADMSRVYITWSGFSDNVDASSLGHVDSIKSYSYAIGSRPGGDDINNFTNVGLVHSLAVKGLNIPDGAVVFVSIKAADHSGLTATAVSRELIVDTSPPETGTLSIEGAAHGGVYVTDDVINILLTGFTDAHSGVDHFEVGIGSQSDVEDALPAEKHVENYIQLRLAGATLLDGHRYYIIVKAINRAGLSSDRVAHSFTMDTTPPTGGHVLDGHWLIEKDVDFQQDTGHIGGHWKGFMDPHSAIYYYRVGLGSRPYHSDVEPMEDVGLRTDILWKGSFAPGEKYYITVEACNGAGLCVTRSSDGLILDNSPPIHGLVRIGSDSSHRRYQPRNSSLHVQWAGFEDPHSGIDHFETCIGTKPGSCDLHPFFTCLLQSNVIKTGLNLSLNKDLYATVKAFNGAGMSVSQSSDAFRVDITPPVVIQKPEFLLDYNAVSGATAQWDNSVLRISWKFEDNDSPISRHIVTLITHHEGHTPVEHVELGQESKLTINLDGHNWLHNGDKYTVVVTCCNEAGLCTTSRSTDLLIDSTPPHVGGFKPPMTWSNYIDSSGDIRSTINLTWYGFVDQESGIDTFFLTVGTSYNGQELTDGIISIGNKKASQREYATSINLRRNIKADDLIVLTAWARNNAGLNSSVSRISVNALSMSSDKHIVSKQHGTLEIEKHSCDVHFCNKDCTCAVLGQPCVEVNVNSSCSAINSTDVISSDLPTVEVYVGLPSYHQNITSSSACLAGHWILLPKSASNNTIQRFEWSIGLENEPIGEGIFDLLHERPWNDVGLNTEFVHCLAVNHSLTHDHSYLVYVRAWYGADSYAVFSSSPVKIDQTGPSVGRGRFIHDSDVTCRRDYDFIDWSDTITGCWDGVFRDQQGEIIYFTVQLGTAIRADDVLATTEVGLKTSITLTNLTLTHGTRYYFTVIAYNNVGLHSSLSSDGFVIDLDTPVAGVVFNTDKHRDEHFQSSNTTFSMSWHGFVDHYSGIKSYHVSLVEESDLTSPVYNFTNVGLRTDFTFTNLDLKHGKTYHGLVKAYDTAGHVSNVSMSRGKMVDITPPRGFACESYIVVTNETVSTSSVTDDFKVSYTQNFTRGILYKLDGFLTHDNNQPIKLSIGKLHMHLHSVVNHNCTRQFAYNYLSPETGIQNVTVTSSSANNMTMTVSLYGCDKMTSATTSPIHVQQIGPSLLAVNLMVKDSKSSVRKTLVGAGTTRGGFQIRPLSRIHDGSHVVFHVDVPHDSPVHVTAITENQAGLRSTFHAPPITFDHTAPRVDDIVVDVRLNDSNSNNVTEDVDVIVESAWTVKDEESGVRACYCALGKSIGCTDIADFRLNEQPNTCKFEPLSLTHGSLIYVTIRCVNNVELSTEVTSYPVTISIENPNSLGAKLSFIHVDTEIGTKKPSAGSLTYMDTHNVHVFTQSNQTCAQLEWSGFDDVSGIDHYEYRLLHEDTPVVDWTSVGKHTVSTIVGVHMTSGTVYSGEVRAVNTGGYVSDVTRAKLLVQGREPKLTGIPAKMSWSGRLLQLDWASVFDSNPNLPVTYSLTIGSLPGFSDVTDVRHVTAHAYDVNVPRYTLVSEEVNEIFITIICTYPTGLFSTYKTSYKMSAV